VTGARLRGALPAYATFPLPVQFPRWLGGSLVGTGKQVVDFLQQQVRRLRVAEVHQWHERQVSAYEGEVGLPLKTIDKENGRGGCTDLILLKSLCCNPWLRNQLRLS
jgi:hypothetical protein